MLKAVKMFDLRLRDAWQKFQTTNGVLNWWQKATYHQQDISEINSNQKNLSNMKTNKVYIIVDMI